MIVIIDNYDSFTYNLYQYVGMITREISVFRNDRVSIGELERLKPSHVIISPGPGKPSDAGISCEVVLKMGKNTPVLGVCLGHQVIGQAYGGRVVHAGIPVHGKPWDMDIDVGCPLFIGMPGRIKGGRYHSLLVERESVPDELAVTAMTPEGEVMALQHRTFPVFGIQFHPESVLTEHGMKIIRNFIELIRRD
jgi:anthranilate synthase component 2